MKQLTVYVNDESYGHFVELIKHLKYVKKVEVVETETNNDIKMNIKEGLNELKKFKKSELKVTTSKQFLDELQHLPH